MHTRVNIRSFCTARSLTTLLVVAAVSIVLCSSCETELKPANIIIEDPIRHYYPVIQGQTLGVTYTMENISDNPLFIQEIQTTCGCLIPRDKMPIVILPHKRGAVHVDFNTIKNTGYVCHYIYCYGNFKDTTCVELQFDTNVVPEADYIRDYEQLWFEQNEPDKSMREFVDGDASQKGYVTDEGLDPRNENKEAVQEEVDRLSP